MRSDSTLTSGISSATGTAVANSSETFECLVVLLCSPASSQVFPRVSAVRKPWRGVAAPSPWPSPRRRSREEAARWRSFSAPFVGPRRRLRGVSPLLGRAQGLIVEFVVVCRARSAKVPVGALISPSRPAPREGRLLRPAGVLRDPLGSWGGEAERSVPLLCSPASSHPVRPTFLLNLQSCADLWLWRWRCECLVV